VSQTDNSMEGKMNRRMASVAEAAVYFGVGLLAAAVIRSSRARRSSFFQGKNVLITGASRGLGLALAEELGRRGARLILAARDPFELERARNILLSRGAITREDDLLTLSADLRDQKQVEELIKQSTEQFGSIDVLINNAGVISVGPIENQAVEQFRDQMESNFFSGLYCTLAVLPQMLDRKAGAIANITSLGGKVAVPHLLPYTASKFAAVGFSQGLGIELAPKGICVTTVVPGLMRTGSHRNAQFSGNAPREYSWFSLAASTPGVSIAADRAARQIANAIASRSAEVTITPQAFVASRMGNVAPAMYRLVMRGMGVFLPQAQPSQQQVQRGENVREFEWFPARSIGSSAAQRYNQT
jgi:short-subunit dehydrogenase